MRRELTERLGLVIATAVATLALACALASPPSAVSSAPSLVTDATQTTVQAAPDSTVIVGTQTRPEQDQDDP